jgi:hypothetical protein
MLRKRAPAYPLYDWVMKLKILPTGCQSSQPWNHRYKYCKNAGSTRGGESPNQRFTSNKWRGCGALSPMLISAKRISMVRTCFSKQDLVGSDLNPSYDCICSNITWYNWGMGHHKTGMATNISRSLLEAPLGFCHPNIRRMSIECQPRINF